MSYVIIWSGLVVNFEVNYYCIFFFCIFYFSSLFLLLFILVFVCMWYVWSIKWVVWMCLLVRVCYWYFFVHRLKLFCTKLVVCFLSFSKFGWQRGFISKPRSQFVTVGTIATCLSWSYEKWLRFQRKELFRLKCTFTTKFCQNVFSGTINMEHYNFLYKQTQTFI